MDQRRRKRRKRNKRRDNHLLIVIPRITSYTFGRIVIDGKTYTSDVIIFPDRVRNNWWRKSHDLCLDDLSGILNEKFDTLVIGTGYHGGMNVFDEVKDHLESKGIRLIIQKTPKAVETYNKLVNSKNVIVALHLTC